MDAIKKKNINSEKEKDLVVFWFRRDLRLSDHQGLMALSDQDRLVIPLYLFSENSDSPLCPGGAATWWVKESLMDLDRQLGGKLVLGNIDEFSYFPSQKNGVDETTMQSRQICGALLEICKKCGSKTVAVTESLFSYPGSYQKLGGSSRIQVCRRESLDWEIEKILKKEGVKFVAYPDSDLVPPGSIGKDNGFPYQVFTPFYKKFLATNKIATINGSFEKQKISWYAGGGFNGTEKSTNLFYSTKNCGWLKSRPYRARGFLGFWKPGSSHVEGIVHSFAVKKVVNYSLDRDFPAMDGTSLLSPYLAFGEVSARQVWNKIVGEKTISNILSDHHSFLRQLVWRLFSKETLRTFPWMIGKNFQEKYDRFPWSNDFERLTKWQKGQTGIPIVDAAMRQLWRTGWMHNRLRMVVGSFLVKNLQIHWSYGEKWFWDTLVDADLANNVFGWQWVAGCGLDAAPFFRIFNPLTQSKKFDPKGAFIRKYLPELKGDDQDTIHDPWGLSDSSGKCGTERKLFSDCTLYPEPIVSLKTSRADTLSKLKALT